MGLGGFTFPLATSVSPLTHGMFKEITTHWTIGRLISMMLETAAGSIFGCISKVETSNLHHQLSDVTPTMQAMTCTKFLGYQYTLSTSTVEAQLRRTSNRRPS